MMGIPRLYAMIGAGIVVALFLAWVWRVDSLRARHLREAQSAELRHSVTTASLNSCLGQIEDNNRRIAEQAKRLETDKQKAAADLARADARQAAQKVRVDALLASARDTRLPACRISEAALSALEGL